jgi:hypothetical protein
MKTILSLYDFSGNWSRPYSENGYNVIQIDIKLGIDILTWDYSLIKNVYGILIAQPCTDYALSGAKHFKIKDVDGRTANSQILVAKTKEIIDYFNPEFWGLENPMTRIHKLNKWIGNVKFKFNPCDFAGYNYENERYNKQTWLFGKFNNPSKNRLEPIEKEYPGFKKLGGKSDKTKELRSITPLGFSYAFFNSNK